jgi:hypothetical protein
MSEDILGQMTLFTTARQVWAALHDMFGSHDRARVMQVRYQLSNLKDLGTAEFFQIGNPLTDEEVLGYMLAGLGPEYEPLVATITARDEPISLNAFYAQLLSAELRIEQNVSAGELYSSANAVSRNHPGGGNRGGGRSSQQHDGNQSGRGRGRGRGRGTGRGGGPKITCQVCNKYGRTAMTRSVAATASITPTSRKNIASMLPTHR